MTDRVWLNRVIRSLPGLFNDAEVDHFIAVKHGWAWAAVRQFSQARVLETNAGYGWLTVTYAMAGANVVAIERSAPAAALCRSNTAGLSVTVIEKDNRLAIADLDLSQFNIIDLDPSGSPQPVLDQVLHTARPGILFVTAGDAFHARFNRKADNVAMLRRYPQAWQENWQSLDVACRRFGQDIVFHHIQSLAPGARLLGYHVWPPTSSARLAVAWQPGLNLPAPEEAQALAMRLAVGQGP